LSSYSNKEEEKLQKKVEDEAKKSFSVYTIQLFGLNKRAKSKPSIKDIKYNINNEIKFLKNEKEAFARKRIRPYLLDLFLYSGDFNSVLGSEGINDFKVELLEHISQSTDTNAVELDKEYLRDLIYRTGLYVEYESAPRELVDRYDNFDHRAYQRAHLLNSDFKSFDDITAKKINSIISKYFLSATDDEISSMIATINMSSDLILEKLTNYLNNENKINVDSLIKAS
jgi:hypothetical protein